MVSKKEISVIEKLVKHEGNGLIALIVAILLILISLLLILGFELEGSGLWWSVGIMIAFYIVVLSFLFEPKVIKKDVKTIVKTIERPVRVPFVIKLKEIKTPIFIEPTKKKEFNFVASSETKTYHTNDCRFGKLIKKDYKLMDDEEIYFKRLKYSPCKNCIKKVVVKRGKSDKIKGKVIGTGKVPGVGKVKLVKESGGKGSGGKGKKKGGKKDSSVNSGKKKIGKKK
jgi:hypothetical protein